MKIEINNKEKYNIDLDLIKRVITGFAGAYKIKAKEISLALVGDAEIKKINRIYRGLNRPTDVLSFAPLNSANGNLTGQAGEGDDFGEIILDYNQIKRQARELGRSVRAELIFILVHGLLHLSGYNDETEKDRLKIIKMGEEFIKNFES